MQQNLTEMKWCKFNTAIDICLYGHNWMVIRYGYKCIISVHVSFTLTKATLVESDYRKVCVVYLNTTLTK